MNRLGSIAQKLIGAGRKASDPSPSGEGRLPSGSDRTGDVCVGPGQLARLGILLLPALSFVIVVFGGAMVIVLVESFKVYTPGRIIQPGGVFTIGNYTNFASRGYLGFFIVTIRLAVLSTLISTILAYPIAYRIARTRSHQLRKILIIVSILTLFLGGMVRVVSLVIFLGSNGLLNSFLGFVGTRQVSLIGTEMGVLIGLVHFQVSVGVLALIGTITNIDPNLEEAAQSLGASGIRTFGRITLPLSAPGILAAAMLSFAAAVSAFAIPLFLGKGIVNMIANLIYDRFSDVLNFPEGAALAVILLCLSLLVTSLLSRVIGERLA